MKKEIEDILEFCRDYGVIWVFEQQKQLTDYHSPFGYPGMSYIVLAVFFFYHLCETHSIIWVSIIYILIHCNLENTTSSLRAKEMRVEQKFCKSKTAIYTAV